MSTAVQEQLRSLVELQKIDSGVHLLKKDLATYPEELKKLEAEFEKKKARLKAAEDALKTQQLKLKEKEGDLASREEKIKKLQAQLYSLKTNKEYSAMELEIKGAKADNSLLEEEILKLFDAVEAAKGVVAKEKEGISTEEKKFKEAADAVKKREAEALAALKLEEDKRAAALAGVDKKILGQYERILKGRDGLALVPVVSGACGGCHMEIPPQRLNEIQMGEQWFICESCARMLYWTP